MESGRARVSTELSTETVLLSVCAVVALAWHLAYWSLILRARAASGSWPRAAIGYPYETTYIPASIAPSSFGFHQYAVWVLFVAVVASWVVVVMLAISAVARKRLDGEMIVMLVAVGLLGVVHLWVTIGDLGGLWTWYLD